MKVGKGFWMVLLIKGKGTFKNHQYILAKTDSNIVSHLALLVHYCAYVPRYPDFSLLTAKFWINCVQKVNVK